MIIAKEFALVTILILAISNPVNRGAYIKGTHLQTTKEEFVKIQDTKRMSPMGQQTKEEYQEQSTNDKILTRADSEPNVEKTVEYHSSKVSAWYLLILVPSALGIVYFTFLLRKQKDEDE